MDWLLALLAVLKSEIDETILNPPIELRTEFGFGRTHGMLLMVETIRQRATDELEAQAERARSDEEDF